MSFLFYDEPMDDSNKKESQHEDDYFGHPLFSGYPNFFYGYPPYYHPQSRRQSTPKSYPKSNDMRRASAHPFDKDVYKLVDFRPKNNLCEDDKNYYIQLDLPGLSKEQIHMELSEDNIITISGERPKKHDGMKISKMECEYGKFSRSFSIPETANIEKIEAKMENGFLEVIIPKAEAPKTQRRTIQVQ